MEPKHETLQRRSLTRIVLMLGLLASACSQVTPPVMESVVESSDRVPVVFVPGVTGVALRDLETDRLVWGSGGSLIRPHDRGYGTARSVTDRLAGPNLAPDSVILKLRLFGVLRYTVYQQLVDLFSANGYRVGDLDAPHPEGDFFLFSYDWRQDNVVSARRLARQLERLREARGDTALAVDLICQSNGAHICRYFAQFGSADLEEAESGVVSSRRGLSVRKLILVGSSNGGSIKVLRELNRGRRYVQLIGRTWTPETLFTFASLYQDLPVYTEDLFVDDQGERLALDLWDAATWKRYQWSIWAPDVEKRLGRVDLPAWFGTRGERETFLIEALDRARRFHRLLHSDSGELGSTRYYLIANANRETPARAVLEEDDGRWRTWFVGDVKVDRSPVLQTAAGVAGDGHATLESQRWLSSREVARLGERLIEAEGTHRRIILEESVHREILGILAESDP